MKHLLYFTCLWFSINLHAQQNEPFQQVSDYYKFHKKAIAEDFQKQINSEKNMAYKLVLKSTMDDFAKRMDSTENISFTYALITTKNNEALKAKTTQTPKQDKNKKSQPASYPGGFQALRQEIQDLFYYSAKHEAPVSYEATVHFVVGVDGYISEVVAEGENSVFNRQAEIAVYRLQYPFSPQYIDGYAVRSRFSLPIKMKF